jgi:protein-disulfide isomerase
MHYEYGQLLGITGTPSIFLSNGQKLSGYIPASELIKIIENG